MLISRSPLSDLVEFEFITTAVAGQAHGHEPRVPTWTRPDAAAQAPDRPGGLAAHWLADVAGPATHRGTSSGERPAGVGIGGSPRRTCPVGNRGMCQTTKRPPAVARGPGGADRGVPTPDPADGTEVAAAFAARADPARGRGPARRPRRTRTTSRLRSGSRRPAPTGDRLLRRTAASQSRRGRLRSGPHPETTPRGTTPTSPGPSTICGSGSPASGVTVGFCSAAATVAAAGGDVDLAGCAASTASPRCGRRRRLGALATVMLIPGPTGHAGRGAAALAETMRAAGADVDAVVYEGRRTLLRPGLRRVAGGVPRRWSMSWR